MKPQSELLAYDDVVDKLVTTITKRDHFIVIGPRDQGGAVAMTSAMKDIPNWQLIMSTPGNHLAMCIQQPKEDTPMNILPVVSSLLGIEVNALALIPKTVDVRLLIDAFNQPIALDGSQDIILLTFDGCVAWPMVLLDAMEVIEPGCTRSMRATLN